MNHSSILVNFGKYFCLGDRQVGISYKTSCLGTYVVIPRSIGMVLLLKAQLERGGYISYSNLV